MFKIPHLNGRFVSFANRQACMPNANDTTDPTQIMNDVQMMAHGTTLVDTVAEIKALFSG